MDSHLLRQLQHQPKLMQDVLKKSLMVPVSIWRYEEIYLHVRYISCLKRDCCDYQSAFLTLLNHYIHYVEEWKISETLDEHLPYIINNQILPYLQQAKWLDKSALEVQQRIHSCICTIDHLIDEEKIKNSLIASHHCRCFYDDVVCDPKKDQSFFPDYLQDSAIELLNNWNEEEFFYQTTTHYVLFSYLVIA